MERVGRLKCLSPDWVCGRVSWFAGDGVAQWKAKDTEWPSYAADLAGTRYRALDQINAANFNDLEIAWRIKTDNFGNRPGIQVGRHAVDGKWSLVCDGGVAAGGDCGGCGYRRVAVVHGEHEGARGGAAPRQLSGRGLAYWSDGKEERILYVTPG